MFGSSDKEAYSSPVTSSAEIIGIVFGVIGLLLVTGFTLFCVKKRTLWPSLYKTRSTSTKQLDLPPTPSELIVAKREVNGSCGEASHNTQYARVVRKPPEVGEWALYEICTMYSPREKSPYPPHGRSLEIPRERGILKANIFEATYEGKLEFPGGKGGGGRGCKTKTFHGGGVWIFSGMVQY